MLASFAFDEAGSPAGYILAYETIRRPRQSRSAQNAEARESSEGCRFGRVTRSGGTRRIPIEGRSIAPSNVAWWPPRWPIEDVSGRGGTRRRPLPGVLQMFKCATCQI